VLSALLDLWLDVLPALLDLWLDVVEDLPLLLEDLLLHSAADLLPEL
jgi:hypothetical protein